MSKQDQINDRESDWTILLEGIFHLEQRASTKFLVLNHVKHWKVAKFRLRTPWKHAQVAWVGLMYIQLPLRAQRESHNRPAWAYAAQLAIYPLPFP